MKRQEEAGILIWLVRIPSRIAKDLSQRTTTPLGLFVRPLL